MTLLIPLNTFYTTLVTLPDLLRKFRHVNRPQIDFSAACSSQLSFVLPSNVHNLTCLLKLIHCFLLNAIWVPNKNASLIATWSNQRVIFVPARAYNWILRPKEAFQLALHAPDSCYVVISTREQPITVVTPLYAWYEVVFVSSLRHFVVICKADVPELHPRLLGLPRTSLQANVVGIPDIHIAISSSSCG